MTTAELLVKCLEQEDVEYIFGIPGEENIDIIHALTESPIRFITTRHEQGAAFMADVYGRLTGRPGVCLSTLGPGATNLMTGVADANLDGAPLIAITAQVGTDKMHITWHQYLDLVNMFQPVTKWSKQIVRPDITPEVVRKAFKLASREKPGAVHINLPNNIGAMSTEAEPIRKTVSDEKSFAAYGSVEKAAVAISRASNPVILAGNEVIRCKAAEAVLRMAESLQIPVVNTFMGKGIIPFTSRYSMFSVGLNHRMAIDNLFDGSDLVICIGYDFIEYAPKMWNSERNIDVIHIGSHEAEVNKYYQPIVNIIGDISDSITEIIRRSVRTEKPEAAYKLKEELLVEYNSAASIDAFPMDPRRILYDVRAVLGEEDILISDVGAHKMSIARYYHCYRPNTCIISNGFAAMGIAVPGAFAAKIVYPERKVLAVTGDGGFMMNAQELETAKREGINFVTLIFRDDEYGLISMKQKEKFGQSEMIGFSNPDFRLLAESMGLKGYSINSASELKPVLEEAFSQTVPVVIDCPVVY